MNGFIDNIVKTAKDNFSAKKDPSQSAPINNTPGKAYVGQTNDLESGAPKVSLTN
jgi:hypothetical protein